MSALLTLWQQDPAFVVSLLLLTWLGYVWPFEVASRNLFVPYLAGFSLFLAYSLVGLAALVLLLAPFAPALLPWRLSMEPGHPFRPRVLRENRTQWLGRVYQVGVDVAGMSAGCVLHATLISITGLLSPPFPIGNPESLWRYLLFLLSLQLFFTTLSALIERITFGRGPFAGTSDIGRRKYRPSNEIFPVLLIAAGPLQYLSYFIYQVRGDGLIPLALAGAWTLMMNYAFNVWGLRGINLIESRRELELARRLARVGSESARIVHRVRHEVALIGIGIARLENQLRSLDAAQASRLREEIGRLQATRDNLQAACTIGSEETSGSTAAASPLADVLARQCRLLESKALEGGIGLRLVQDPLPPRVLRDPALVGESLFNVIENAIVAARSTVIVRITGDDTGFQITVQDDGTGMSTDTLARAFDPFYTTKPDGSGMGLAIARGAIEQEGGTIGVDNTPEGLLVTIRLPRSDGA